MRFAIFIALSVVGSAVAFDKHVKEQDLKAGSRLVRTHKERMERILEDIETSFNSNVRGRELNDLCTLVSMVDCTNNNCVSCLDNGGTWMGLCLTAQGVTTFGAGLEQGLPGYSWSGDSATCATPATIRMWSCGDPESDDEEDEYNSGDCADTTGQSAYGIQRTDMTLSSDYSFLNSNGELAVDVGGIFASMSMEALSFGLFSGSGANNAGEGPPSMYQATQFFSIPAGGFGNQAAMISGSSVYAVFDGGFAYQGSSFPNGVGGSVSDFSSVTFSSFPQGTVSATFNGETSATLNMCSTATSPQVCLNMLVSKEDFNYEGKNITADESKVDVVVNGVPYTSNHDSFGLRMLVVAQSFDLVVDLTIPDNGDVAATESYGAAYIKTATTVLSKNSAISDYTDPSATSVDVKRQSQVLTSASSCGYGANDWYTQSATGEDGTTYASATEYFDAQNFRDIECTFYSFHTGDATKNYFLWDPVIGVDKAAAQSLADSESPSSSDDDVSTVAIVGITIGVVAVVGILGVAAFFVFGRARK